MSPEMKEQLIDGVQHAASSKGAMVLTVAAASTPSWIDKIVTSTDFQNMLIILGAIVSLSIIAVNIQTIRQRLTTNKEKIRQAKIQTKLLEKQAKELDITIDD